MTYKILKDHMNEIQFKDNEMNSSINTKQNSFIGAAQDKFRNTVQKELQKLLDKGLHRDIAIRNLLSRITNQSQEPTLEEINSVMQQFQMNKEDAIHALIVKEELGKLKKNGYDPLAAIKELTRKMELNEDKYETATTIIDNNIISNNRHDQENHDTQDDGPHTIQDYYLGYSESSIVFDAAAASSIRTSSFLPKQHIPNRIDSAHQPKINTKNMYSPSYSATNDLCSKIGDVSISFKVDDNDNLGQLSTDSKKQNVFYTSKKTENKNRENINTVQNHNISKKRRLVPVIDMKSTLCKIENKQLTIKEKSSNHPITTNSSYSLITEKSSNVETKKELLDPTIENDNPYIPVSKKLKHLNEINAKKNKKDELALKNLYTKKIIIKNKKRDRLDEINLKKSDPVENNEIRERDNMSKEDIIQIEKIPFDKKNEKNHIPATKIYCENKVNNTRNSLKRNRTIEKDHYSLPGHYNILSPILEEKVETKRDKNILFSNYLLKNKIKRFKTESCNESSPDPS